MSDSQPGRPPNSPKGSGSQKTVWFTPENLARIAGERVKAGPGTSFNEAVNALVESGSPDAVEANRRRLAELGELRRLDSEKNRLIARLQSDLEKLGANAVRGSSSLGRLEFDLSSVHPKSRKRIASKLGIDSP